MRFLRFRAALLASASALFLASCGGGSFSDAPVPARYSTTLVLGSSISDVGNSCNLLPTQYCPPSPPYAAGGRNSNGPLYIERLAAGYGASVNAARLGGTNYAYAAARTGSVQAALNSAGLTSVTAPTQAVPNMVAQTEALLAARGFQIPAQALVVVEATTVGNNINDALTMAGNPANAAVAAQIPTAVVTGAVTDIVLVITRLYSAGARNILVMNSPDVGRTPQVRAAAQAAAAQVIAGGGTPEQAQARAASIIGGARAMSIGIAGVSPGFNGALAAQLPGLRATMPGATITLFDVGALEAQIVAGTAPGGFTLANVTDACLTTTPTVSVCATPDQYFYWDGFHPTARLGEYIAQQIAATLPRP